MMFTASIISDARFDDRAPNAVHPLLPELSSGLRWHDIDKEQQWVRFSAATSKSFAR